MMPRLLALSLSALVACASPALAQWSASLVTLSQTDVGATGSVTCEANGTPTTVWGTGTYTSDSSICGAAQHFGWFAPGAAATVSYRAVPGLNSYEGSVQNGVQTLDFGAWTLSFQITGATPLAEGTTTPTSTPTGSGQTIAWTDTADTLGLGSELGSSHSLTCPAGGATGASIWGSGLYTSDSAVCVAAAHSGLIDAENGGTFTIVILGSQNEFASTRFNGISSSAYPSWPRSFAMY